MQTKPKSNSIVTHAHDAAEQTITFHVVGCEPLVLYLRAISDEVAERAFIHGMVQRVSDAAAISRNPETGQPATPQDKRERMARLVEHYMTGTTEWSPNRGTAGPRDAGLTITAMGDVFHKLAEECREMVARLAAKRGIEERAALALFAATPEVAKRIAELKAERAEKSGVSAADILAEIE